MNLRSLTNVRPVKDAGTQLIANSTKGNFRLSIDAAKKIGVVDGDYLDIAEHPEQQGTFFIGKGFIEKDEEGKISEKNGSKLARSGSYLQFSSAGAWADLGDEANNTAYEVTDEEVDSDGVKYFQLGTGVKTPKTERKATTKKAEAVETTEDAFDGSSGEEVADVESVENNTPTAPSLDEL